MSNILLTNPITILTDKLPPREQAKSDLIANHTINETKLQALKDEQAEVNASWGNNGFEVSEQELLDRYYDRELNFNEQYDKAYEEIVVTVLLSLGLSEKAAKARAMHYASSWHTYSTVGELLAAIHNEACFITKEEPMEYKVVKERKKTKSDEYEAWVASHKQWKEDVAKLEQKLKDVKPVVQEAVDELTAEKLMALAEMRERHRFEKAEIADDYAERIKHEKKHNPSLVALQSQMDTLHANKPQVQYSKK